MPSRNSELVRVAFDCFRRDDFESARELIHPEVRWYSSGAFPGFDPLYVGHERVREWWQTLQEPWESFTIDIEQEVERGNRVILAVRFRAVGKESGVPVDLPFGQVFEFEDGLVTVFRPFPSWEEALAAAS
ncbi:MAG TPA: nuclear transport factor 2 family protein [Thermoleophilaceae bacterium]